MGISGSPAAMGRTPIWKRLSRRRCLEGRLKVRFRTAQILSRLMLSRYHFSIMLREQRTASSFFPQVVVTKSQDPEQQLSVAGLDRTILTLRLPINADLWSKIETKHLGVLARRDSAPD